MARLPEYLTKLAPVGETLAAMNEGWQFLQAETAERNAQLSVATADRCLSAWERDYALADGTGQGQDSRRSRIRAAMAGGQTLTRTQLQQLAVTLGGADHSMVEEDFANWRVVLCPIYDGRLPLEAEALRTALERIKPAHLMLEVAPKCVVRGNLRNTVALTAGVSLRMMAEVPEQPA